METNNHPDKDPNKQPHQGHTTDPQENEKNGNVLGEAFDTVFGNSEGTNNLGAEEDNDPKKRGSIKE